MYLQLMKSQFGFSFFFIFTRTVNHVYRQQSIKKAYSKGGELCFLFWRDTNQKKKTSKASLSGNLKSKNWVDFFESNFLMWVSSSNENFLDGFTNFFGRCIIGPRIQRGLLFNERMKSGWWGARFDQLVHITILFIILTKKISLTCFDHSS